MEITADINGYLRESNSRERTAYIHTQAAEKKLGRKIGKKEVIHHIDKNKLNNSEKNLLVLRSQRDHALVHSKIPYELFETKDGSFVAVKEQRVCKHCEGMFEPKIHDELYCSLRCYAENQAKNIPSASDLKKMVWSMPTSKLANILGVSDVAIGKWCTRLGVDKPPRGYWQKKAFE